MNELKDIRNLNFKMYMARLPPQVRSDTTFWARKFLKKWREHVKGLIFNDGYV